MANHSNPAPRFIAAAGARADYEFGAVPGRTPGRAMRNFRRLAARERDCQFMRAGTGGAYFRVAWPDGHDEFMRWFLR